MQLTDESICDSCRARLGTKLFAMYPDDSVVCYRVCLLRCFVFPADSSTWFAWRFQVSLCVTITWFCSAIDPSKVIPHQGVAVA